MVIAARALAVMTAALALVLPAVAVAWTPEATTYGVVKQSNLAVTSRDGTVLRADVYYPTNPGTQTQAEGPFPVILTQTPYGKDDFGANKYLVQRGYIQVVADVRGTGGSEGAWGLFDPVQDGDGAALVDWAAALPHSTGDVGLLGPSYLGIDQFGTAVAAGPAHVKAMFPIIAANDIYRDTSFAGGFPDMEFMTVYAGLTAGLNTLFPLEEHNPNALTATSEHIGGLGTFHGAFLADLETGGEMTYDQNYWAARNPVNKIAQIVRDGIPAFLVGGWYDLFQRGEVLNYSSFQNAYAGRPLLAPMDPGQKVTARYQLIQGPWYHVTAGDGLNYHGLNINGVELAWFDRWLKGIDTGITNTTTPLHAVDLGTGRWVEATRYPFDEAEPQRWYLGPKGSLSRSDAGASGGSDTLLFTGSQIPCNNATEQWAAGLTTAALSAFKLKNPCSDNANLSQVGPGQHSYTSAPFDSATTLAGPIGASLYASTTTTDSEWVVQISDVAANGTARSITDGLLEGNQRALDDAMTWKAPDGQPILPWHPYTKAAQAPATTGKLTRYDVEVFPTMHTFKPGHRVRVTIATGDFPHTLPTAHQLPNLIGGVYTLGHSSAAPSSVELPMAPADAFARVSSDPLEPGGATSASSCVARRTFTLTVGGKARVSRARASVGGKRVRSRLVGRNKVRVTLRRLPKGAFRVHLTLRTKGGHVRKVTRRLRACPR